MEPQEKEKEIAGAIVFASGKFANMLDDAGLPKVYHSIAVGDLVSKLTDNLEVIQAAYLHDTLEDTDTTLKELDETFGVQVAELVMQVTHKGSKETGYYFPYLKSRDAILIKFCDRVHNISRMDCWDEKRREHYLKNSRFWRTKKDAASLERERD